MTVYDCEYSQELEDKLKNMEDEVISCTLFKYREDNGGKDIITDIAKHDGLFKSFLPKNLTNLDLSSYTKLTKIDDNACQFNDLTCIKLPDNLIKIGDYAFFDSSSLKDLDLSNCTRLTKLGRGCFERCGLTSFKLPLSIKEIGSDCFDECKLTDLDLSKYTNLTRIGEDAFENEDFENSEKIRQNSENVRQNIILPTSLHELNSSFNGIGTFIVPDHITRFADNCFEYKSFRKLVLNSHITHFNGAGSNYEEIDFRECKNLERIDDYGLSRCYSLTRIDLSMCTNLTRLGDLCFDYELTEIKLPKGLIEIGENCFELCYKLKEIDLRECKNLKWNKSDFHPNINIIV